jgi:hypothetical protein
MYRPWLFPLGATHALYRIFASLSYRARLTAASGCVRGYIHAYIHFPPSQLHTVAHNSVPISTAVSFLIFEIFQVRRSFNVSQQSLETRSFNVSQQSLETRSFNVSHQSLETRSFNVSQQSLETRSFNVSQQSLETRSFNVSQQSLKPVLE